MDLADAETLAYIDVEEEVRFEAVEEERVFWKLGGNWVTTDEGEKEKEGGTEGKKDWERHECAVCLTDRAEMVWVPCGHLSVCLTCGRYLMDNGKV